MKAVFARHVDLDALTPVLDAFEAGASVETGETTPSEAYAELAQSVDGLGDAVTRLVPEGNAAVRAAACELVFEGLHLHKRLNKDRLAGGAHYRSA